MSLQSDHAADVWGPPPAPPQGGPAVDLIQVGELPTDVIPRVWAESILRDLRADNPGTWRKLLGKAASARSS